MATQTKCPVCGKNQLVDRRISGARHAWVLQSCGNCGHMQPQSSIDEGVFRVWLELTNRSEEP